jgi:GntR family transcriptional regulator
MSASGRHSWTENQMASPGARAKVSSDDRGVTRRAAVAREPAAAPRAGVDPASPTPLYHQIFSLLRGQIYDGQYPGGSFLPSEQELSAEFNVSRITAKRALDELAADGLVVREQGRGTRVCINTHSTSVRGSVRGLVHSLHANGRGSVQLLDFDYLPASEAIAAQLGLNVGDEVQRAIRIWHGEEGPFSHLTTFVPGRLGRSWTGEDLMRRPLISLLEKTGVTIARAEERITAVLADAVVAARLAVEAGAPLLMITRTVFDTQDRSVEHLTALYPPERYQYSVSLGP